jgi:TldD protein
MSIEAALKDLKLDTLKCFYADIRLEEESGTRLGFKNGELEEFAPLSVEGAFLRVYNHGKWFYKAITNLQEIQSSFVELIDQSQAFIGKCEDIFSEIPKRHDEILRFEKVDPRKVTLTEKRKACESYLDVTKDISEVKELRVIYKDRYQKRAFKSSRGRSFVYDFADYGLIVQGTLREGNYFFTDKFRHWGQSLADIQGQSVVEDYFLESRKHLEADTIQPGKYPVVMNSEVVGVFTHESFGHKSEADFMLGDEAAIREWKIGSAVAANCVSIVDDGGSADNSGYCPIDDEGLEKSKTYLIKNGILKGRLHSLKTAYEFKEAPTGNARAMNFEFEPIVRMTNTYIEPGMQTEEELIASIKDGVYVSGVNHGSGLSTFTIAPKRSYWIRNGRIAEPVRIPVISGTVFDTLNKITGVSQRVKIDSSTFGGCGKDEQSPLRVADGGPLIAISEMQVG